MAPSFRSLVIGCFAGVSLLGISIALIDKHNQQQHVSAPVAPATAPQSILKVQAGQQLIEVLGDDSKGVYVFQPFVERGNPAFLKVLEAIIEHRDGEPVFPFSYIEGGDPSWLIMGAPDHQVRVMITKDSRNGDVYGAIIRPN